jgi:pyruvate-ferredoxin/flavodoxin oxidoreductase
MAGRGDDLPVSALPVDGTFPTGTTRWEKRNLALGARVGAEVCIQCGRCVMYCPHAVIRAKVYDPADLAGAGDVQAPRPAGASRRCRASVYHPGLGGGLYRLRRVRGRLPGQGQDGRWAQGDQHEPAAADPRSRSGRTGPSSESLPERPPECRSLQQHQERAALAALFEFHTACAGCGETPYIRLLSQLFGDRLLIGNATGCSSIYTANLPGTAWAVTMRGAGPAWNNSLFEDNAEFTLGLRLTLDKQPTPASCWMALRGHVGAELADEHPDADQSTTRGSPPSASGWRR